MLIRTVQWNQLQIPGLPSGEEQMVIQILLPSNNIWLIQILIIPLVEDVNNLMVKKRCISAVKPHPINKFKTFSYLLRMTEVNTGLHIWCILLQQKKKLLNHHHNLRKVFHCKSRDGGDMQLSGQNLVLRDVLFTIPTEAVILTPS